MAEMVCSAVSAPIHAPCADVIVSIDADALREACNERGQQPETAEAFTQAEATGNAGSSAFDQAATGPESPRSDSTGPQGSGSPRTVSGGTGSGSPVQGQEA